MSNWVSWVKTAVSALGEARDGMAVCKIGSTIYISGGAAGPLIADKRNDVWSTTDGITFTRITASAAWSARYEHQMVAVGNVLYVMGGYGSGYMHDVWKSVDFGANWTLVTASAAWSARVAPECVVLSTGTMVLMGGANGSTYYHDVYSSTDGDTWTLVTAAASWEERAGHRCLTLTGDVILLAGGHDAGGGFNPYDDVWTSSDGGATWTENVVPVGWYARTKHSLTRIDSKIFLFGGYARYSVGGSWYNVYMNDMWLSIDNGATWTEVTETSGYPVPDARQLGCFVPLSDGLLIVGGSTDSDFFADAWFGRAYIDGEVVPPTPPITPVGVMSDQADGAITYQLNSSTSAEDTGNQYEHLMGLRETTNYDLRDRPNFRLYTYSTFYTITKTMEFDTAAFTTDEFKDWWFFVVGASTKGVVTYGIVASNTADTLTLSSVIGDITSPVLTDGTVILMSGWYIDFLPDLSQPSVVQNLDVNEDCFEYSDNDDKRKLSTKIVATGKDLFGKTISVMVAAVHGYNNPRQMFNDATIVTRRSEGYIYKNNFINLTETHSVTATKSNGGEVFTTNYGANPTYIMVAANWADFVLNAEVTFSTVSGTLPSGISAGTTYYIVNRGGASWFEISTTPKGVAIDIGSDAVGTCYVATVGGLIVDNTSGFLVYNDSIVLYGVTAPGGVALGSTITNNSPTYTDAAYWINCGASVGPGVGSGLKIYPSGSLKNPDLGTTPTVWLYGWSYTIPSGSAFAFCIPNSGIDGALSASNDVTTEATDSSGVQYTQIPLTEFPESDFSGRGYLMADTLWVQDYTVVGNNEVLIGEEKITIETSGNDTTYGHYITFEHPEHRVTSASLKAYPHDVGALVARTNYTEASPETTSAISLWGINIGNFTVDGNITYGQLDTYVTYMLLGLGNFYRMATTWSPLTLGYVKQVGPFHGSAETSLCRPIAVGDRISTTPYSGDTPVEYEVVEVTIKCDEGRLLLQLGDFEKNVFTSLEQKTNAVNRTLS